MTRFTTKLFVVALTVGSLAMAASAEAGGCSGGGGYGGLRGPNFPSYRRAPSSPSYIPQQRFQPQPQPQFQPQPQPQQVQAPAQAPAQGGLAAFGGTQQQQAPAANTQQTAEMTALQALAGMGGNQAPTQQPQQTQPQTAQPAPTQTQPAQVTDGRVGTWVAKVGSEATVQLDLRADGSFVWTATRNGKSSNFQGQYSMQGGKLTLTRADNQSLAGDLTSNANGFNFKLNGTKDAGLNFARS